MRGKRKVFLGGPVQHALAPDGTFDGRLKRTILRIAETAAAAGFEVLSCHLAEAFGRNVPADPAEIATRDYRWMRECDLYVALLGGNGAGRPVRSDGTFVEIGWATALQKPVILILDHVPMEAVSHLVRGLAASSGLRPLDLSDVERDAGLLPRALQAALRRPSPHTATGDPTAPGETDTGAQADLTHLKIFADYRCDLRCAHCVHGQQRARKDGTATPETDERMHDFLAGARRVNPDLRIYLSGGEPLLSPRFFQLAGALREHGFRYKTITNGMLLGRRWRDLLAAPPEALWVTFNGTGSRHDRVVGLPGAYETLDRAVREGLPRLREAGVRTGAVLMINPLTHARLAEEADRIARFGFDEIVVQHLSFLPDAVIDRHKLAYRSHFGAEPRFCFGQGADGSGIEPGPLGRQLDLLRKGNDSVPRIVFPPISGAPALADYYGDNPRAWRTRRCRRALHELWVLPDGTVTVCFEHAVGHVGQGLEPILASPELARWRERFRRLQGPLPGCARCHRLYLDAHERPSADTGGGPDAGTP